MYQAFYKLRAEPFSEDPEQASILLSETTRQASADFSITRQIDCLTEAKTAAYIHHRLRQACGREDLFSPTAVAEIHAFSGGLPELINIIGDLALLAGFIAGAEVVSKKTVQECVDLLLQMGQQDEEPSPAESVSELAAEDLPLLAEPESMPRTAELYPNSEPTAELAAERLRTAAEPVMELEAKPPQPHSETEAALHAEAIQPPPEIAPSLAQKIKTDPGPELVAERPRAIAEPVAEQQAEAPQPAAEPVEKLPAEASPPEYEENIETARPQPVRRQAAVSIFRIRAGFIVLLALLLLFFLGASYLLPQIREMQQTASIDKPAPSAGKELTEPAAQTVQDIKSPAPAESLLPSASQADLSGEGRQPVAPVPLTPAPEPATPPAKEAGTEPVQFTIPEAEKISSLPVPENPASGAITIIRQKSEPPAANSSPPEIKQAEDPILVPLEPATPVLNLDSLTPSRNRFPWHSAVAVSLGNLRNGPSMDALVIATLRQGDQVTVLRQSLNWYFVELASGQSGWLHKALLPAGSANKKEPDGQSTERASAGGHDPAALAVDSGRPAAEETTTTARLKQDGVGLAQARQDPGPASETSLTSPEERLQKIASIPAPPTPQGLGYTPAMPERESHARPEQTAKTNEGAAGQRLPAEQTDDHSKAALQWTQKSYESLSRGQYQEAIEAASLAISLAPGLANPYVNRAWAYSETGLYDKAIDDCRTALALDPDNPMAYNNLGLAYQRKGNREAARLNYQKACNLDLDVACNNYRQMTGRR